MQRASVRILRVFQSAPLNLGDEPGLMVCRTDCSRHAGRTMISTDDVMLLCRRNEGLETLLKDFLADTGPTESKASSRR